MKIFECPTSLFDSVKLETDDSDYVFEHLKYFFSRIDSLPAVVVSIKDGVISVESGGVYLQIARALNRNSIRIVLRDGEEIGSAVRGNKIVPLSAENIYSEDELYHRQFHLIVFKEKIGENEVKKLKIALEVVFGANIFSFQTALNSRAVEFKTKQIDERAATKLLAILREFNEYECEIDTYQGRLLPKRGRLG